MSAATPLNDVGPVGTHVLPGFTTGLFVQGRCKEAIATTDLVATSGVGVVHTLETWQRPHMPKYAGGAIEDTRRRTGTDNVLVDAAIYGGSARKSADAELSPAWVAFQHGKNLPWALTDSGYVAAKDLAGLKTLLANGARLGERVITALPIASTWLSQDADLLRTLVSSQPNPIAVMVEDKDDPFDRDHVVDGLVHLIGADNPVLLLRCDTSALGALAHGAAVGAVGTRSGLRHIFPHKKSKGGGTEKLSFVIPALLGYYREARFDSAYLTTGTLPIWTCRCSYCAPHPDLSWIGQATIPTEAGFQHSVAALAQLGAQLTSMGGRTNPIGAWAELCGQAQAAHDEVSTATDRDWSPKRALKHWISATPTPVGR